MNEFPLLPNLFSSPLPPPPPLPPPSEWC